MTARMRAAQDKPPVRIAVVGKYVELHDAYMSVKEALLHAANANDRSSKSSGFTPAISKRSKGWDELQQVDGIVVPGGFGYRGIEGKILAARYAREQNVPYLGLCLGMQAMCIEFARDVLGLEDANSTEFETSTEHPVIDLMPEQRDVIDMGGTMRLGVYPCELKPGSIAAAAYGERAA